MTKHVQLWWVLFCSYPEFCLFVFFFFNCWVYPWGLWLPSFWEKDEILTCDFILGLFCGSWTKFFLISYSTWAVSFCVCPSASMFLASIVWLILHFLQLELVISWSLISWLHVMAYAFLLLVDELVVFCDGSSPGFKIALWFYDLFSWTCLESGLALESL